MKGNNFFGALRSAAGNFSAEETRKRRRKREATSLLRGAGLGAGAAGTLLGLGLMFFFDPRSGAGRRERLTRGVKPDEQGRTTRKSLLSAMAGLFKPGPERAAPELTNRDWKPAAKLAAGLTGGAMVAYGAKKRGARGWGIGAFGASLLAGGVGRTGLKSFRRERTVEINRTILIHAPIDRVFAFWSQFENFPRFMANVKAVNRDDHGRSHWKLTGPTGKQIEWDAIITKIVENRLLSWKSIPGSSIDNSGTVRFTPTTDGSTRIHVQIGYAPPTGKPGHLVADLFGLDARASLEQDLDRMKNLLESRRDLPETRAQKPVRKKPRPSSG